MVVYLGEVTVDESDSSEFRVAGVHQHAILTFAISFLDFRHLTVANKINATYLYHYPYFPSVTRAQKSSNDSVPTGLIQTLVLYVNSNFCYCELLNNTSYCCSRFIVN